jgi:hypothetical protein
MAGLSNHNYAHALGATFVFDNSLLTRRADSEQTRALTAATELAQTQGLPFIYLLD